MAKPPLDIDPEQVYKLAKLHCTIGEIADVLGCSRDTLERRFRKEIEKGKAEGRQKLRLMQWAAAAKGNVTMLIWLGKQILSQSDQPPPDEDADETYTPPDSMVDDRTT